MPPRIALRAYLTGAGAAGVIAAPGRVSDRDCRLRRFRADEAGDDGRWACAPDRPHRSPASPPLACAASLLLARRLAASAAAASCDGKHATIVGTAGQRRDRRQEGASDVIYGGGGNDRITGGPNGNDTICGGPGDDTIHGGRGFDALYGEGGDDKLAGETGSDHARRRRRRRQPRAAPRAPTASYGGAGDDSLIGAKGPDTLDRRRRRRLPRRRARAATTIDGGGGDDKLLGDKGNDQIDGGAGNDQRRRRRPATTRPRRRPGRQRHRLRRRRQRQRRRRRRATATSSAATAAPTPSPAAPAPATSSPTPAPPAAASIVDLAAGTPKATATTRCSGFEDVVGSPQADTIVGDGEANRLDGGVGNDDLDGRRRRRRAFGGAGSDECSSGFATETPAATETAARQPARSSSSTRASTGASLIVQGGPAANDIRVSLRRRQLDRHRRRRPIFAGERDGCDADRRSTARQLPGDASFMPRRDHRRPATTRVVDRRQRSAPRSKSGSNGNAGADKLIGGPGDDVLEAGDYNDPDTLDGGAATTP